MGYKLKRIMMWVNAIRLPAEYQEVERIGTSGSQWIDTGFVISGVTGIQTETKIEVNTTSQNIPVFGCRRNDSSAASSSTYYHLTPYSSKWYYGTNGTEKNAGTYSGTVGTQYTIIFNNSNSKISVNGTEIGDTSNATGYSSAKLAISRRGTNYSWDIYYGSWNYYYFNIYNRNTNTYERQMIPCYRKSDNVIGMYDLVTNTFYTNNGSGTFTKGNDVPDMVEKQVRPSGGPFIYDFMGKTTSQATNDGWILNNNTQIDSGGLYNNMAAYPLSNIGQVDNTKKITISWDFKTGTVGSWTDALITGFTDSSSSSNDADIGAMYLGLMTNRNYKLRWIIYVGGGTVATNNVTWNSNTEYNAVYIIDLANKALSFSATKKADGSSVTTANTTISDNNVLRFVASPYIFVATGNRGRIENISVTIE